MGLILDSFKYLFLVYGIFKARLASGLDVKASPVAPG